MCGIFGVINFDEQPVDKEKILSARDVLAHRGPDDSGVYYSQCHSERSEESHSVALAHRRLSIIDLSPAAHQPMTTEDGRYTIVFNGEIYNYRELIPRLTSDVSHLTSSSDTEVILKLFALEGPECLNRLRGMFAFAIWDDKEKKLFAARDRFGIKPFYYLHNNNEFIFSSELKAIKHYKNGLTLSMEGMDAFLRTGSVPAPLTIYEETKALLPGHWLECQKSNSLSRTGFGIKCQRYWTFTDIIKNHTAIQLVTAKPDFKGEDGPYNHAQPLIRASLLDTIKAHMVSDVEVGAFLSGGIDSTAIVSLMRQAGHEKIKTISVTFPGNKLDESKYSNLAAKKYETNHFEYRLQEDELINDFDKIIESMDQPTIDGINTYFVSKAAASFGLKVVLSGLGGDELFGGYPSFINIPKYQRIKSLPFAKTLMKAAGFVLNGRLPAKAIEYFRHPDDDNAEYNLIRGLFTDSELRALGWQSDSQMSNSLSRTGFGIKRQTKNESVISSEARNLKNKISQSPDLAGSFEMTSDQYQASSIQNDSVIASPDLFGTKQSLSPLQYISFLESCVYMRNQLLRDSDVFSMAHSLEMRVPFVDHLLYSAVLPHLESSFDRNFPKKMLVDAVGDLPDGIVHRPKQGFTFPFADWMKHGKIKEAINDTLNKNTFGLEKKELSSMIRKFETGNLHWSRVWAMFIASRF